jgi:hypothetical protein
VYQYSHLVCVYYLEFSVTSRPRLSCELLAAGLLSSASQLDHFSPPRSLLFLPRGVRADLRYGWRVLAERKKKKSEEGNQKHIRTSRAVRDGVVLSACGLTPPHPPPHHRPGGG